MACCCASQGQGGDLVAAAAALSVLIAKGKTSEQLELIAALFEIIGDNLSLLALKVPSGETYCADEGAPRTECSYPQKLRNNCK